MPAGCASHRNSFRILLPKKKKKIHSFRIDPTQKPASYPQQAQNWHTATRPLGDIVIKIWAQSVAISPSYDRNKLASFPYWKSHQKFRIFASACSRFYRRIFEFSLRGMVEHAPILHLTLKVSWKSTKISSNFHTEIANDARMGESKSTCFVTLCLSKTYTTMWTDPFTK